MRSPLGTVQYQRHGDRLAIHHKPLAAWVLWVLGGLGLFLFPIGLVAFLLTAVDGFQSAGWRGVFVQSVLIAHFMAVLGLAFLYVGFGQRFPTEELIFGPTGLSIHRNRNDTPVILPYAEAEGLRVLMERGGPDNPDHYALFWVTADGARVCLSGANGDSKEFAAMCEAVRDFTGLALVDSTSLQLGRAASRAQAGYSRPELAPAPFVLVDESPSGTRLALRWRPKSINKVLAGVFIMSLFLLVPVYLLNGFVVPGGPPLRNLVSSGFAVVWFILVWALFVFGLRGHSLVMQEGQAQIVVRLGPITVGRTTVPYQAMRKVRVNRGRSGAFSLCLIVDRTVRISPVVRLLTRSISSPFGQDGTDAGPGEQAIVLFECPRMPGAGPGFADLRMIESRVEERLGLRGTA